MENNSPKWGLQHTEITWGQDKQNSNQQLYLQNSENQEQKQMQTIWNRNSQGWAPQQQQKTQQQYDQQKHEYNGNSNEMSQQEQLIQQQQKEKETLHEQQKKEAFLAHLKNEKFQIPEGDQNYDSDAEDIYYLSKKITNQVQLAEKKAQILYNEDYAKLRNQTISKKDPVVINLDIEADFLKGDFKISEQGGKVQKNKNFSWKSSQNWQCQSCKQENIITESTCGFCKDSRWRKFQRLKKKDEDDDLDQYEFDYLLIVDFECNFSKQKTIPLMEIVEFPVIVVDVKQQKIVDKFSSFVKPVVHRILEEDCQICTGITQEQVNESPIIEDVLENIHSFLKPYYTKRMAVVNDCDSDSRYLRDEVKRKGIQLHKYMTKFIDIRQVFPLDIQSNNVETPYKPANKFSKMMEILQLEAVGNSHCGFDDAVNIANIVIELLKKGYRFTNRIQQTIFQQSDTNSFKKFMNVQKAKKFKYLVFLQLTNNFSPKTIGKGPVETIMISAVIYNQQTKQKEDGLFKCIVKPKGNHDKEMQDYLAEKKFISEEDLQKDGKDFSVALQEFENWVFEQLIAKYGQNTSFSIVCWDFFPIKNQIKNECFEKQIHGPEIMSSYIDFSNQLDKNLFQICDDLEKLYPIVDKVDQQPQQKIDQQHLFLDKMVWLAKTLDENNILNIQDFMLIETKFKY